MSEELEVELFEEEGVGTPSEIAARLRELASMIEAGSFTLGDQDVTLPATLAYELEFERSQEDGELEFELEFELRWRTELDGDDDDDDEADDDDDEDMDDDDEADTAS